MRVIFMTPLSYTEENYLKAIYHLSALQEEVFTNDLAESAQLSAASVTDMLKKLSVKKLVHYKPYKGVTLTESGTQVALQIIRKHRLWEVFLVEKLQLTWDQVHEIAEQLEHIQSPLLIERLDAFLDFPQYDPHGDPIPNEKGQLPKRQQRLLSELAVGVKGVVSCLKESSGSFLRYLDHLGIGIGTSIKIVSIVEFDSSFEIEIAKSKKTTISYEVAKNIYLV
ncbi:MAG: metal-dependent transcriptional regulator [Cytophagaceae bacterium]|jgi:DtxR family Mn-dependent transcriptional regulator|nr:metal-dependent transcriptional regulator [Cytophagaceae bacterium]